MEAAQKPNMEPQAETKPEPVAATNVYRTESGIEIDMPGAPDARKPLEVAHYINAYYRRIWSIAGIWYATGMFPKWVNQSTVFAIITTGYELGIAPSAAVRSIYPIQGKEGFRLTYSADLCAALAIQAGVEYQIVKADATGAVIRWRRGKIEGESSFGPVDAKAAGLSERPNYQVWPARMYISGAKRFMARDAAPDRTMNLYGPEEFGQEEIEVAARAIATTAGERSPDAAASGEQVTGGEAAEAPSGSARAGQKPRAASSASKNDERTYRYRKLMAVAGELSLVTSKVKIDGRDRTVLHIPEDEGIRAEIKLAGVKLIQPMTSGGGDPFIVLKHLSDDEMDRLTTRLGAFAGRLDEVTVFDPR